MLCREKIYVQGVSKKMSFLGKIAITTLKLIQNAKYWGVLENSGYLLPDGHWDFQNWRRNDFRLHFLSHFFFNFMAVFPRKDIFLDTLYMDSITWQMLMWVDPGTGEKPWIFKHLTPSCDYIGNLRWNTVAVVRYLIQYCCASSRESITATGAPFTE